MTQAPAPLAPDLLLRIAMALERLAPMPPARPDFDVADAFVWSSDGTLTPVPHVNRVEIALLKGIDRVRDQLLENTQRFAAGLPANNALLWGARGMGKSSLVKALMRHQYGTCSNQPPEARRDPPRGHRRLPALMGLLRHAPHPFSCFATTFSFDADDTSYKSLKAVLEGGIEGRPSNVLFYATSNRRHLLPRDMMDNERATAINPGEAIEEKVSLSDRFGLWLGFHKCSQDEYLDMVEGYATYFGLGLTRETLAPEALEWSDDARQPLWPDAWQFIQDLAGR